ncbi:MAG: hypothetical protein COA42_09415, partial [Alteromonadaceae bacterium]
ISILTGLGIGVYSIAVGIHNSRPDPYFYDPYFYAKLREARHKRSAAFGVISLDTFVRCPYSMRIHMRIEAL